MTQTATTCNANKINVNDGCKVPHKNNFKSPCEINIMSPTFTTRIRSYIQHTLKNCINMYVKHTCITIITCTHHHCMFEIKLVLVYTLMQTHI